MSVAGLGSTTGGPDTNTTFAQLGVHPKIVQALNEQNVVHPFPIQALSLPISLTGSDLIGQARTGTGKTLAFGITAIQRTLVSGDEAFEDWEHAGKPQVLILCPTRELSTQVANDLALASKYRKVRVANFHGGVPCEPQLELLQHGVDVVVGTPGRLLDLVSREALDLQHVRVAVLDEADEMLDLGFLPDVEKLLSFTPANRQTMLFSATMPAAIMALARTHLTRPVNIRAESQNESLTVPQITQFVYQAHELDKPEIMGRLLQSSHAGKIMVFCKTKRSCQRTFEELSERGFKVAAIHGDLNQEYRERNLKRFRKGQINTLVATDVAARGIDVSGITHVINYECPEDEKTYVHRIGRTGRAGADGVAITLVDWRDTVRWKTINKALSLDFETPVETYSTSPHLYTDLDIPQGTKGRIPGAVSKSKKAAREGGKNHRQNVGKDRRRNREDIPPEGIERPREPRRRTTTRKRKRFSNGVEVQR